MISTSSNIIIITCSIFNNITFHNVRHQKQKSSFVWCNSFFCELEAGPCDSCIDERDYVVTNTIMNAVTDSGRICDAYVCRIMRKDHKDRNYYT